jgi:hypothetical protein
VQNLDAIHSGHQIVEKDQLGRELIELRQRLRAVAGPLDGVAQVGQLLFEHIEIERLVVDD